MKKVAFILLACSALFAACTKNVHVPVSYAIENEQGNAPQDVYLVRNGATEVDIYVKFLTGSPDSVTLEVQGVPATVTVSPQRATGIPTYYYKYVYTTTNTAVGTYPVSILATAPGTQPRRYNYNLIVIPNDCGTLFVGSLNGSNACSARSYTYAATVTATGTTNQVAISNFGGYGTGTSTLVNLNCDHDSLYIPSQNIGNGNVLQGTGTFTTGGMTIWYTVSGTSNETCTATLSK